MLLKSYIIFGLGAVISKASDKLSANNIGTLLYGFESYINASLYLDKADRQLTHNWTSEFQLQQVNITSHYRLEMTRHREHSFRGQKTNPKWKTCISLNEIEIKKSKSLYFDGETECLRIANSADKDKVQAINQLEKEIRKWRKSYRYLSNMCKANNPDDNDAANACLVDYVKKDNYDVVFQRLIIMKLEAMDSLLVRLNNALSNLEDCLKTGFAEYLNNIRNIMFTLNKCYSRLNKE